MERLFHPKWDYTKLPPPILPPCGTFFNLVRGGGLNHIGPLHVFLHSGWDSRLPFAPVSTEAGATLLAPPTDSPGLPAGTTVYSSQMLLNAAMIQPGQTPFVQLTGPPSSPNPLIHLFASVCNPRWMTPVSQLTASEGRDGRPEA